MKVIAETEGLLRAALSEPGLVPAWSSGQRTRGPLDADAFAKLERLVGDAKLLVSRPARSWDPVLAQAWMAGLIYLRDESSRISDNADLTAKSLIVRDSTIGAFATIGGDRVIISRSTIGTHAVLEGPLALVGTRFAPYVIAGPFVVVLESGVQHFAKLQRFVRVEKSLIGSNAGLEGGTHPEQIPLGPNHRVIGVSVARDCWIGQNCSLTAGAALGPGVVVAPNTTITRAISELVFVSGMPARQSPIDFNIRDLSPEKAREEGALQGHYAVGMPMFGRPRGARVDERSIEIDFSKHAFVRGLASENAVHFHRGVLETTFAQLFPDYRIAIAFRIGASVRFDVTFDRPLVEHAVPVPELEIRRTARPVGDLSPELAALLARIAPTARLETLGMTDTVKQQVHALALAGYVEPALFRRGANAGLVDPTPEPAVLASRWRFLVDPHAAPLPPLVVAERAVAVAPPINAPIATILARVEDLVRRLISAPGPLDVEAPFYELGIDSVLRAELGALVEQQFAVVVDIFAEKTVRSLAITIDRLLP